MSTIDRSFQDDRPDDHPNKRPEPGVHETHLHENHVHVDASANRQLYVMIGSILVAGGLGSVAWGAFQTNPALAETAASGLTLFITQFVLALFKKGVLTLPKGDEESLPFIKGGIRKAWDEIQEFIARSNTLVLILIVAAQVIVFLVLRQLVWTSMGVFQNIWVAGGVTALAVAPFVIPGALPAIIRALKNKEGK